MAEEDTAIRWPIVLLIFGAGCVLAAAGVFLGSLSSIDPAWSNLFVDVGVTTSLGATLFLLQKSFIRIVKRSESTLRGELSDTETRFSAALEERDTELERLNDIVSSLTLERHQREDDLINRVIVNEPASVLSDIVRVAEKLGAITGNFRVRIPSELDAPAYRFSLNTSYSIERDDSRTPLLNVIIQYHDQRSSAVLVPMDTKMSSALAQLVNEMEVDGMGSLSRVIDPEAILTLFREQVALAVKVRRGESNEFVGSLVERYDESYAITSEGIEKISEGILIPGAQLPDTGYRMRISPVKYPERPSEISLEIWDDLVVWASRAMTYPKRKGF